MIDFLHSSFREYLLAEYYIESLLEDKPYNLDICLPTSETMLYFDGLLEMIGKTDKPIFHTWAEM